MKEFQIIFNIDNRKKIVIVNEDILRNIKNVYRKEIHLKY